MTHLGQGNVYTERGVWEERVVDGKRTAAVACPGCGLVATLDHDIAPGGIVTPSVECPRDCGFHDMVQLIGWDSGA